MNGKDTVKANPEWLERNFPCMWACPVHTEAGRYVDLIAQGRFEEAYRVAREPNPFASICGRICAAPCEAACRRGRVDEPIAIRALKRFACERFGVESMVDLDKLRLTFQGAVKPREKWVAVIGAGPAGLSCAHDLALQGYKVTVFEAREVPGGMLRLGIPEYRLPRELIRLEINLILSLGVELKLGRALGTDFTLADLRENGYSAVFLGMGAHRSRLLDVEGMHADGVLNALDFLLNVNLGYRVDLGERIIVIGGGNVAIDVARTAARMERPLPTATSDITAALDVARSAVRFGAKKVDMVILESAEEMPADKEEIGQALEERITMHHRRAPKRILTEGGKVTGLETLGVASVFDARGRFSPVFREGTEDVLPADTVIVAIGQTPDLSWLDPEDGIETTPRGTIQVDPETLETTAPGIFAGGDLAFGPRIAISAVADGRRAAESIHARLSGGRRPEPEYRITRFDTAQYRPLHLHGPVRRQPVPTLPLDRRVGISQVELGYRAPEARREGSRCLRCWINTIFEGDPALGTQCIACGGCVDVCPEDCIELVHTGDLEFTAGDRDPAVAPWGNLLLHAEGRGVVLIKDEAVCIRCGLCARRCPAGTITMQGFERGECRP